MLFITRKNSEEKNHMSLSNVHIISNHIWLCIYCWNIQKLQINRYIFQFLIEKGSKPKTIKWARMPNSLFKNYRYMLLLGYLDYQMNNLPYQQGPSCYSENLPQLFSFVILLGYYWIDIDYQMEKMDGCQMVRMGGWQTTFGCQMEKEDCYQAIFGWQLVRMGGCHCLHSVSFYFDVLVRNRH